MQEQLPRATHDSMDGGGRTLSGTSVEEQLPRMPGVTKPLATISGAMYSRYLLARVSTDLS